MERILAGVEFAGTLRDFVRGDLARKYPELMDDVEVVLLQSAQSILTQFSGGLQQRALDTFRKTGVAVRTGVRVIAVTQDQARAATDPATVQDDAEICQCPQTRTAV